MASILPFPGSDGEAAVDEVGRGCLACEVVAAAVVMPALTPDEVQNLDEHTRKNLGQIQDSKKMSPRRLASSAGFVRRFLEHYSERGCAFGIGTANVEEIDRLNIREATILAMHRALDDIGTKTTIRRILVDGDAFRPYVVVASPPSISAQADLADLAVGADAVDAESGAAGEVVQPSSNAHRSHDSVPVSSPLEHRCVVRGDSTCINVAAASILAKVHRDEMVREHCRATPSLDDRYDFVSNKAYGTKKHMDGLKAHGPCPLHRRSFAPVVVASARAVLRGIV